MWSRIRLGHRVMLGFVFALGLLLIVSFIGRHVMTEAIDRVDKANAVNTLITGILQIRPDENAFIRNGTESDIRTVLTRISRLRLQATSLKAKFSEAEDIRQITLVERKLVEYLKAFLTFVNTQRLEKEVLFFMRQASRIIMRNVEKIDASLWPPRICIIAPHHHQDPAVQGGNGYPVRIENIEALKNLISEARILQMSEAIPGTRIYPHFLEKKIASLAASMRDLRPCLQDPEVVHSIDESIRLLGRYRPMIMVYNNLNHKQSTERQRMMAAADAMHQVCNTVSRRQNDIVKTKISFAHRMSLVFILGGVVMGLLIGLLVTVSINRAMEKIRAVEKQLRESKEAAEAANKAKSVFLANMSHELRTPLNAVLGFCQLMRKDPTVTRKQSENLDIINKSGEHLLNLINDVLDMSKIEAGRIVLEHRTFDLSGMILDISEMMRHRANSKGLELRIGQSSDFPRWVCADQAKIRQILINLLSNAIKYTEKGHVILRLNAIPMDGKNRVLLHLEVEDSGIGISRENRHKIFEPFEQAIKNVDTVRGTGLGLAITRQYVELMGGTIGVESDVGRGSVFRVELPVEKAANAGIESRDSGYHQVAALEEGQPQYRLLIVEDDMYSRLLLRQMLERVGFVVREAENGPQAIERFRHFRPHLIWMDRRLPGMNGLEVTRRIRKLPGGRNTVIVALTASVFKEQRAEVLAAGCDDFVSKPFQEGEIMEAIARHLGVRYRLAQSDPTGNPVQSDKPIEKLSPGDVWCLPAGWRTDFLHAARAAQGDEALALVAALDPGFSAQARKLKHLIENFRFDLIVACFERNGGTCGKGRVQPG